MGRRKRARRAIARFDPDLPVERASTPPASWYVDPAFFALEQERVLRRHWLPVGRALQLGGAGAYFTGHWLGEPLVVVRGEDDVVRGFHNVCRHHAAEVARGAGRCAELRCPYHGWCYGLDGALRRAPRIGGIEGLDRDALGLVPVRTEVRGPLVFVCSDPGAPPLAEWLGPLAPRLDAAAGAGLRHVATRRFRLACNWKVFVDNYLDGGYHVAEVHPDLGAGLSLDAYRTEFAGHLAIQTAPAGGSERLGDEVVYAWLHPGFMLNRYGPVLDTNRVVPLAVDRTEVVFDFYFEADEGEAAKRFIEESIAASERVQREDVAICESVQRGLRSASYERGRYAPRVEAAMHHFHRLLHRDLGEAPWAGPSEM
jgi:choline monooxygenase